MTRSRTAATTALGLLLLLAGCASGPDPALDPVATSAVDVDDNVFTPEAVAVPVGTEVTWTWVGQRDHNVVATGSGAFDSGLQAEGTFSHTFDAPGRVAYRCTLHGGMTGVVVVGGGGASASEASS